jgi:excisionase family DNA binding protein
VEFEFSLVSNSDLKSLNRKIVDVKPLIPFLNEEDIDDLKTKAIQSLQSDTSFTITNFNIANRELNINGSDVFIEGGGLGLLNYETLVLINFMKGIEKRLSQIEKMLEQNRQNNKENEIEVETEKLLDIQGVSDLLGLAKATIYSKLSRNELPYMKRGKKVYFKEKEILEYLNRGKVLSNDEIEELARKKLKGKY